MKSTFWLTVPPLIWISLMCAFFCLYALLTWVWQMARMVWQYFLAL